MTLEPDRATAPPDSPSLTVQEYLRRELMLVFASLYLVPLVVAAVAVAALGS